MAPRPAVAGKSGLSGSGHRGDDVLGVHHPDPMVFGICYVQAAAAVYRNTLGRVQRGRCGLASVTRVTRLEASRYGGNDAAGVHLADPVVEALRDPDVTQRVRRDAHGAGKIRVHGRASVAAVTGDVPAGEGDDILARQVKPADDMAAQFAYDEIASGRGARGPGDRRDWPRRPVRRCRWKFRFRPRRSC